MDVRMDLDGLVAFDGGFPFLFSENEMTKHGFDSSLPKQSVSGSVDDECRIFKMARTDDLLTSKTMLQKETLPLIRSNSFVPEREQSQPLSFSFPRAQSMLKKEEPFQRILYDASLSNFQSPSSTLRTTGLSSKSTKMNVQGVLTGIKGPFTPSQWMELELQALIYKYLNTNTPIPSNLLAFIRKTFYPYTYSGSTIVSTKPNTLGWGSFHLGFPGTLDSEPGRCRRTDGKKWRCSRDAVPEQKYCERHLNRGRHRSRKSVEGQTCVAFSGSSMSDPRQINSYPVTESTKNSITEFRTKNLQTDIGSFADRKLESKSNVDHEDSRRSISFPCSVNSEDPDKDMQLLGETTEIDYTLIANDPTQNSQKGFDSSVNINDQEQKKNAFRFFLDDRPKIQFDRNVTNWFDVEDIRTDKTQPSISIPAGFDFSPSSPRPIQEKLNPAQKFTSMGTVLIDQNLRQENSFPISWENAMGGPLGEVLKHSKNSSPWDSRSRLDSSPSGVLATFGSLSNSSADSIPIQAHGIT